MNIELITRQCRGCSHSFRVLPKSPQAFCSRHCAFMWKEEVCEDRKERQAYWKKYYSWKGKVTRIEN